MTIIPKIMNRCLLPLLAGLTAAVSGDTIFEATFDDYSVKPQIAKGDLSPHLFTEPDLQLRMFPGINNQGNSLNLANSETLHYAMPGNFNPKQGSVTLWLSPQNWQIAGEAWQQFFYADQPGWRLRIEKVWPDYINVTLHYPGHQPKAFSTGVHARIKPDEWTPGRWHMITVTWNSEKINLYLDGRIPEKTPTRIGSRSVPSTAPEKQFVPSLEFPEASPKGFFSLGLNERWKNNKNFDPSHKTAFDRITIDDRPLSAAEVLARYEKIIPPAIREAERRFLDTIPKIDRAPAFDGTLDDLLWKQAARFDMRPVEGGDDINGRAFALHDGKNLYLAFSSSVSAERRASHERDDKLWEDDCFEFHYQTPDQNTWQYIINANGALYDQKNRNKTWNGSAQAKTAVSPSGWSACLVIPLDELGGLPSGRVTADFCAASHQGLAYRTFRWGASGKSFGPSGELQFGRDGRYFRLDQIGDLRSGNLNLRASGDRIIAAAKIIPDGYSPIAYSENPVITPWQRKLPAGRQRLEVEAPGFYYRYFDYSVSFPLELSFNLQAARQCLELTLDFSNAGEKILSGLKDAPGKVELIAPDQKTLSSLDFKLSKPVERIFLPLPEHLNEGTYRLQAVSLGLTAEIPLQVPDLEPFLAKVGKDDSVPEPWTPVKQLAPDRYQVWDREYVFGKGPFPKQITAGGEPLFSSSPEWLFDGKPIAWNPSQVVEIKPDRVVLAGSGGRFDWRGELWFDGAYILNFTLSPGKVDHFQIRWQVPEKHGLFVRDPYYIPWEKNRAVPGSSTRYDNVLWLTGHDRGVFFWFKSNANFRPKKSPLEAIRSGAETIGNVTVIGTPSVLPRRAEYTMVMMGTPSRPYPAAFRAVNYGGWAKGATTHQFISGGQFVSKKSNDDMTSLNSYTPQYPDFFERTEYSFLTHIYSMPGMISNALPEYNWLGQDSWRLPRLTHRGIKLGRPFTVDAFCDNASELPADLQCWQIDRSMKQFSSINGIYFDVAATYYCENTAHGCGGTDVFGEAFNSSNALGRREFMKRIYKTVHRNRGTIMLHSHIQFLPVCHAFVDMFAPGENTFHLMAENSEYGYCEAVSPEQYQSDYNHRLAGVPYCMLLQTARAVQKTPALAHRRQEILKDPEYAIRALTPFVVHDLNVWAAYVHKPTVVKFWNIRKQINLGTVKAYHGYWESEAVKSTSPRVYYGWYEWDKPSPYRRVIVAGNFNREPVPARLEIDFKALGVPEPECYFDLWNGQELTKSQLEKFSLPGNHFLMIGIR